MRNKYGIKYSYSNNNIGNKVCNIQKGQFQI